MSEATGCAIGPDGQLLPASQIQFFHDADSAAPIDPAQRSNTQALGSTDSRPSRIRKTAGRVTDPANMATPELSDHRAARLEALEHHTLHTNDSVGSDTDNKEAEDTVSHISSRSCSPSGKRSLSRSSTGSMPGLVDVVDSDEEEDAPVSGPRGMP
jgi:hypothetical protein